MRTRLAGALAAIVCVIPAKAADVEAPFLGAAVYSTSQGCKKLQALAAGGPRNISTVPETLDRKGYHSWEGGCEIERIQQQVKGKRWLVALHCHEGPETQRQHETWELAPDGALLVTLKAKKFRYTKCPVVPAPEKKN